MFHYIRTRDCVGIAALVAAAFLALSGCSEHRAPDELARAVATGERPVSMKGTVPFFGNQLSVTVTVSRGIGKGGGGGGGGGGHHGGGGANAEMPDVSGMDNDDAVAYMRAKYAVGSPMPPVTLHLRIENLTQKTLSVKVDDFESDLGNFAVNPEVLAMAPTQVAEPDPMISQLGVTSDDIPVKVTLVMNGKTETQTVDVKNLLDTSNAAPPPPPAKN